jgi:uroporphyrinogen decarboxylase
MSKRERLEATFRGEETDRPPVALWRHWPGDDNDPVELARAQIEFQRQYDFDFMKVTPNAAYLPMELGVTSRYAGSPEGSGEYLSRIIHSPDDWTRLPRLEPTQGRLGLQLRNMALIGAQVGDEVPFIETVFSPTAIGRYIAGEQVFLDHLRRYPEAVLQGLEAITATSAAFVATIVEAGASGIFFAVQGASYLYMSEAEYRRFGRPFDLRVLQAADRGWLNLLHLHGNGSMFDLLADYPVQIINWHDRETPPSLGEGMQRTRAAVLGGLRQWETMVNGTPEMVATEAADALAQTGGRRFILGTGCVTPVVAPTRNIIAARQAVEPRS